MLKNNFEGKDYFDVFDMCFMIFNSCLRIKVGQMRAMVEIIEQISERQFLFRAKLQKGRKKVGQMRATVEIFISCKITKRAKKKWVKCAPRLKCSPARFFNFLCIISLPSPVQQSENREKWKLEIGFSQISGWGLNFQFDTFIGGGFGGNILVRLSGE